MRRFHVIAVTPNLTHTLTIRTSAGWLLPWLDDDARTELPLQLDGLLRPLISTFEMVHEAPLPTVGSEKVVQGYIAVVAPGWTLSSHVDFVPNDELRTTPALLALHQQAWSLALERLHHPVADFDSHARVTAALDWAKRQVDVHSHARVLSMTRHRCSRYEYVVRVETTKGAMYFKGGLERVSDEGVLTDLLYEQGARCVPETLAIDVTEGRWIYRELPGALLIGSNVTPSTAASVTPALAALQKRASALPSVRDHLASRRMTALDLFEAADRAVEASFASCVDARQHADAKDDLLGMWHSRRDALIECCATVDSLQLPLTLVLSDFWPRNILATPEGVGFIDLERCYWSYPFLSLCRFMREVERSLHTGGAAHAQIESASIAAWADIIPAHDMTRALAELPLLGDLFELLLASRELDLRERELGAPLSGRHRATMLSPHVRELLHHAANHQ